MVDRGYLVVGGSGFIGRALQEAVIDEGLGDAFTFACNEHPENIREGFKTVKADLTQRDGAKPFEDYSTIIFAAGHSNPLLANKEPWLDLELNVSLLLNTARHFRGKMVLLSCQSVYQGLEGEVQEHVDHVPTMPFGLSKSVEETYARHLWRARYLDRLWIHRLGYTYGKGEAERRLVPMCNWAASNKGKVHIHGGGKSYLNPLPARFVAEVLLRTADELQDMPSGFIETTNLNHPAKLTAAQVVRVLDGARRFGYEIDEAGEEWPVRYYGNTERLEKHLKKWEMEFPDAKEALRDYFMDMQ